MTKWTIKFCTAPKHQLKLKIRKIRQYLLPHASITQRTKSRFQFFEKILRFRNTFSLSKFNLLPRLQIPIEKRLNLEFPIILDSSLSQAHSSSWIRTSNTRRRKIFSFQRHCCWVIPAQDRNACLVKRARLQGRGDDQVSHSIFVLSYACTHGDKRLGACNDSFPGENLAGHGGACNAILKPFLCTSKLIRFSDEVKMKMSILKKYVLHEFDE